MNYLILFVVSFLLSLIFTPLVRIFALKIGAVDKTELRKVHTKRIIVRLGGIAFFLSFYLTLVLFGFIQKTTFLNNVSFIKGIFFSSLLILALGIYDDLRGADAKLKFFVQITASLIILYYGIKIDLFTNPFKFGQSINIGFWGIPLTMFWLIFITNSLNLLDGLDGLAAGVSCIILITMFFIAFYRGDALIMAFTISLAGATAGFLRYNFNPAKIFMGDTGSLFLGFTLAALSIKGSNKSATTAAMFIPLVILGLPIIDTSLAITRRLFKGKNIFKADNEHIHHNLIKIGLSQRKAVLILYGISILLGLSAFLLAIIKDVLVAAMLVVIGLSFFIAIKYFRPLVLKINDRRNRFKD